MTDAVMDGSEGAEDAVAAGGKKIPKQRKVTAVAIRKWIGFNTVSPQSFMSMEKQRRAQLIKDGKVQFFDQQGNRIGIKEALTLLRSQGKS